MEVAVHQIQWEREEEEREEEQQMRRQRRPEISTVDICDVIDGDDEEVVVEEEEGSNSNYELSLPKNVNFKDEVSVSEDSESNDDLSVPENGHSKDELSVTENGKSKDDLSITVNGISVTVNGKSKDELSMAENGQVQVSDYEENGHFQTTVVNNQYQQNSKDDNLSDIKLLPAEKPVEEPEITQSSNNVTVNGVGTEVLKEDDEELNDLDVERVLKEQNTHDLFCPNCHSCITRRVILRKRKRNIKNFEEDGKRSKPEVDAISEDTSDNTNDPIINTTTVDSSSQTPAADEYNRDTEPDVFRCLSCFTFFIPTGNGFKLFNMFGDKKEKENLRREQTSSVKKNWLSSIFTSHKEETLVDRDVQSNFAVASLQEIDSSSSPLVVSSSAEGPELTGKVVANTGEKPDQIQKEATGIETVGPENDHSLLLINGKGPLNGEGSKENTNFKPQGDGSKILVESTSEASALEKKQPDQKLNTTIGSKGTDDKDWLFPESISLYGESENKLDLVDGFPFKNGKHFEIKQAMPIQSTVQVQNVEITFSDSSYSDPYGVTHNNVGTKVDIHIEKTQIANADASSPSLTTSLLLPDNRVANNTKDLMGVPQNISTGGDTVIIVTEKPAQTAGSHQAQDIIVSEATGLSSLTERVEDRDSQGVEVIKSIVYGGLVEAVTSLGIVSSAAGSETAIINIVALGLANLFGGFFIIFHSLWDLKNDDYGLVSDQRTENAPTQRTQRIDKYRDLLGRRENFFIHATIAILSYLIFGLLPPVIYGFSFRESNDRYYKLLTVAASSLLCITVLSVGKAYVQRPPKPYVKTVFYYVALGFMASGVSYVAGDLIIKTIEKLGWLNTAADLFVPIMRKSPVQTGWSSY